MRLSKSGAGSRAWSRAGSRATSARPVGGPTWLPSEWSGLTSLAWLGWSLGE